MFNTQNSLLLNQHNGDDAPQDRLPPFDYPSNIPWAVQIVTSWRH